VRRSIVSLIAMSCLGASSLLAATAATVPAPDSSTPASGRPPNILFIMSDDHTTQAIGAYGGRLAKLNPTPHIDALAKNGMRFDRVFCHNAICTPSRATNVTGQYSQKNGVLDLEGSLPPETLLSGYKCNNSNFLFF